MSVQFVDRSPKSVSFPDFFNKFIDGRLSSGIITCVEAIGIFHAICKAVNRGNVYAKLKLTRKYSCRSA